MWALTPIALVTPRIVSNPGRVVEIAVDVDGADTVDTDALLSTCAHILEQTIEVNSNRTDGRRTL